jgi:uncharacterized protein YjbI with pentapeptide repeats
MQTSQFGRKCTLQSVAALAFLAALGCAVQADIFQWEYVNPADPSQGKRPSPKLVPGGAGVEAAPGAWLGFFDLTMAHFSGADLTGANISGSDLTGATLNQANLTNAYLSASTLTDAEFAGAHVQGAHFDRFAYEYDGTGIALAQLYSTASYQAHDLRGISLRSNDLRSGNFVDQNLAGANFSHAELTGADFTNAQVGGASLETARGFTAAQLYSTASYQDRDLTNIRLGGNLSRWNFEGQNLTNAWLYGAMLQNANFRGVILTNADLGDTVLTSADFTYAEIRGAWFGRLVYGGVIRIGITPAQLYSTASYHDRDLTGVNLTGNNLSGASFAGQNLTRVDFGVTNLAGVDFTDAQIRAAGFAVACFGACGTGITAAQLYSTASYRDRDLTEIILDWNNLSGFDLSDQGLTNTHFDGASLFNADLSGADMRGAKLLTLRTSTVTTNLIRPDGHIHGLDLDTGGLLVLRDYDGDWRYDPPLPPIPITIDDHAVVGTDGTLRMVFEADTWDSTISFAPGIPVTLAGTLELTFAADVDLASEVGRRFRLFDWTGVDPIGELVVFSPYLWDLSRLHTTGEVTLMAVPEPTSLRLIVVAAIAAAAPLRRTRPTKFQS